jgi:uncharacterized membrane protein
LECDAKLAAYPPVAVFIGIAAVMAVLFLIPAERGECFQVGHVLIGGKC